MIKEKEMQLAVYSICRNLKISAKFDFTFGKFKSDLKPHFYEVHRSS